MADVVSCDGIPAPVHFVAVADRSRSREEDLDKWSYKMMF